MILRDVLGTDAHDLYRALAVSNLNRQYSFLQSVIIRALNFHAIACLETPAGEYRNTEVTVGNYHPPNHVEVPTLMNTFVEDINQRWDDTGAVALARKILDVVESVAGRALIV